MKPTQRALNAAQEVLNSLDSPRWSTVESLAMLIDKHTDLPALLNQLIEYRMAINEIQFDPAKATEVIDRLHRSLETP